MLPGRSVRDGLPGAPGAAGRGPALLTRFFQGGVLGSWHRPGGFARLLARARVLGVTRPAGRPPVGWAEGGDEGAGADAADDGGVDDEPERERGGENFHVAGGAPRQGDEGQEQDEGRGGDQPAGA